MMQGKKKEIWKRSIIVLFTDAPGHPLPTYKNTIHFLFV